MNHAVPKWISGRQIVWPSHLNHIPVAWKVNFNVKARTVMVMIRVNVAMVFVIGWF